ncbi:pyrimidine dimer DNA glycosylase/endonuclease V [Zestomonas carbonaria]|uniref:Pyrimidine dimer DNA glycosylase /DNA-(Apurinic or apyrimidinic site) lyase n=1 Tax=Zestomonas carbonaria TaxID=2762745 RepID=A0A7U7EPG8_9GAMM|nr:pyrimidine dimer DNA glycosylase/endonuclease V [Pseudomonas carbonaria]CAD5107795.1 hypothetical protein PSEWESI4_02072 [Pseudomonas carbonaria]
MRLWSLHPGYLDPQGLVALWREALLAQAVLRGETRGYRNHPQLERFRQHPDALSAISHYLQAVQAEAESRGYRFDKSKIAPPGPALTLDVTAGQVAYEWAHLMAKLSVRNPELHRQWVATTEPRIHPLFNVRDGDIEPWERPPGGRA